MDFLVIGIALLTKLSPSSSSSSSSSETGYEGGGGGIQLYPPPGPGDHPNNAPPTTICNTTTQNTTSIATIEATTATATGSSNDGGVTTAPTETRSEYATFVYNIVAGATNVLYDDSASSLLSSTTSPQRFSYNWLVNDDEFFPRQQQQQLLISTFDDEQDKSLLNRAILQRYILGTLYFSFNMAAADGGEDNDNVSWLSNRSVCDWNGISCDDATGDDANLVDVHVSRIDLGKLVENEAAFLFLIFLVPNLFSLKLTRHLPPHHSITDSRNLSGTIPREIVLLKHLTYLDLGTFMLW